MQVVLADAFGFSAFGFHEAVDLNFDGAADGVFTNVGFHWVVTTGAVIKSWRGRALWGFGFEHEPWREHLFHEQACCYGFEGVVDRVGYSFAAGVGFSYEVGEPGAGFSGRVAGGAADDLHHFGEAAAVPDGEGMLAPDPVETFLGHTQGDDDVHEIPVVLLRRVFKRGAHPVTLTHFIINKVSDAQELTRRGPDELEARNWVDALPFAEFFDDVFHFPDLVFGAFVALHAGDVDDGFLVGVEHVEDLIKVGAGVEVVPDVEVLEVLVPA